MSEIEKKIDECIEEVSQYRFFSAEAEMAIKSFEELKKQLKNLSRENIDAIIRGVEEGYRAALPYAGFLPTTVANLKFIKEWLEKKREEL